MRLGLSTPVAVQTPGTASAWENGASIVGHYCDQLAALRSLADTIEQEDA